jgi:hypothetical protein
MCLVINVVVRFQVKISHFMSLCSVRIAIFILNTLGVLIIARLSAIERLKRGADLKDCVILVTEAMQ